MFSKQFMGYSKKEVDAFVAEHSNTENTLKGDIEFLKKENQALKAENEKLKSRKAKKDAKA